MLIGFTSTSFRQIRNIEKIVKIASQAGVDCIEWGGDIHVKDLLSAKKAKKLCDDAGIKVCSYGSYYRVGSKNTDAFMKIRNDVGCDNFKTYFQSKYKRLGYDLDRIERTMPYIENIHISYSEQTREQFPKSNPDYINKLLGRIVSLGFNGNLLVEYTYLFSYAGIPSAIIKDVAKIRTKVGLK